VVPGTVLDAVADLERQHQPEGGQERPQQEPVEEA
jgi:hypothetical protein